jgi:hypothetical protein
MPADQLISSPGLLNERRLLLDHLFDHGDPDTVENELPLELLRISGELQKRKTRRDAVR